MASSKFPHLLPPPLPFTVSFTQSIVTFWPTPTPPLVRDVIYGWSPTSWKTSRNSLFDSDFCLDFLLLLLLPLFATLCLLLRIGVLLLLLLAALARVGFALLSVLGFRLKRSSCEFNR